MIVGELVGEVGEFGFDLDAVGLVADEGGHAGGDAESTAPFAEGIAADVAGLLEGDHGGVNDGRIAGEVAGVAAAEAGAKEVVAATVGLGKHGGDVVRNFVGPEAESELFEGHSDGWFSRGPSR